MKRSFDVTTILLLALALACFAGCSSDSETPQTVKQTDTAAGGYEAVSGELLTLKDTLEYTINTAMERLRLGDKSGLYENEFSYYVENNTFDKYLRERGIFNAQADSLKHVDVVQVIPFGGDSVDVYVVVRFEGKSGVPTRMDDRVTMYYHKGRWIRPTVSNFAGQLEYDKSGGK